MRYINENNMINKEEKIRNILHSVQTISALSDCITIEFYNDLIDYKFKQPILNQKAKRIKEYCDDIKKLATTQTKVIDADYMAYEHSTAMHRLFKWFSIIDAKQINEYMDELERLDALPTKTVN